MKNCQITAAFSQAWDCLIVYASWRDVGGGGGGGGCKQRSRGDAKPLRIVWAIAISLTVLALPQSFSSQAIHLIYRSLGLTLLECAMGKYPYDASAGPLVLMMQVCLSPFTFAHWILHFPLKIPPSPAY